MGRGLGIFPARPKTPFVPGEATTRDKRAFLSRVVASPGTKGGPPIYSLNLRLPHTRSFLICAAPPSSRPSRLLLRRRPRAPPELRRLHAPAALDDDPARPLTGKPPPAELFAAAARCASCSRRPPRHASASTGAARPYWCSHRFAPPPPGPTAAGTAALRLPCFAPPLGHAVAVHPAATARGPHRAAASQPPRGPPPASRRRGSLLPCAWRATAAAVCVAGRGRRPSH